jgi:hypothetical protein
LQRIGQFVSKPALRIEAICVDDLPHCLLKSCASSVLPLLRILFADCVDEQEDLQHAKGCDRSQHDPRQVHLKKS